MISLSVAAQNRSKEAQQEIKQTIKKVYATSVRMWGFDPEKNERTSAQFSGVVVSADGLILTAAHTVAPGRTYKVFFPDGRVNMAKALGRIDLEKTPGIPDAGMLQIIEKGTFPYADIGNSHTLRKGEPCISISYPERLNQELPTVRFGEIADPHQQYGFLQSTCKMEPGDSGGPLFDAKGKVIGIHSAIDVDENMNFEIPIDIFKKYWTALHQETNYTIYPTADSLAKTQTPTKTNWQAKEIPAKLSKLQKNVRCLSTGINGGKATATLVNYIDAKGQKTQFLLGKSSLITDSSFIAEEVNCILKVIARDLTQDLVLLSVSKKQRGGFEIKATDTLQAPIGTFITSIFADGSKENSIVGGTKVVLPKSSSIPYLGISVLFRSKPAAVSVVKPGSPAANLGIKTGDLILKVNDIELQQASDFMPAMSKFWAGETVKLKWSSNGNVQEHSIKLIDRPFIATNHPVDRFAGGSSARRDGFTEVFVHDAIVLPNQCGSAIVDANGKLVGINIARYSRAVTLAIPTATLADFIGKNLNQPTK